MMNKCDEYTEMLIEEYATELLEPADLSDDEIDQMLDYLERKRLNK